MFRRRRRNFSRFRSRFKMRKRSLYPHSGGSFQLAQFWLPSLLASSEAFSNVEWTELLKIEDHIGGSDPQGAALNQIARYIEVRAIQCEVFAWTTVAAAGLLAVPRGNFFAGLAIDRLTNDVGRPPVAAATYDPFATMSPISDVASAGVDETDYAHPMRWLRTRYQCFPIGNADAVASTYSSNSAFFSWRFRYTRRFRLSDETGLYAVRAFNSTATGGGDDDTYNSVVAGKLWYRVGFGR